MAEEISEERRLQLLLAKTSAECMADVFNTIVEISEEDLKQFGPSSPGT